MTNSLQMFIGSLQSSRTEYSLHEEVFLPASLLSTEGVPLKFLIIMHHFFALQSTAYIGGHINVELLNLFKYRY